MANDQISLPYLIGILAVSVLVMRWLFFSSPAGTPSSGVGVRQPSAAATAAAAAGGRRTPAAALRAREAAVERIQQMFPQVDRRTILWDMQRNGGNLQATTERILAGRMETPPISFQPAPPPNANPTGVQTSTPGGSNTPAKAPEKPVQPDLITRYKLHDKIAAAPAPGQSSTGAAASKENTTWSSSREERQALLQRRREDMILAARRKMEAKIAAEKAAAAGKDGS